MAPMPPWAYEAGTERILAYAGGLLGGSVVLTSAALLRMLLRRVGRIGNACTRCARVSQTVAQQVRAGEHHL